MTLDAELRICIWILRGLSLAAAFALSALVTVLWPEINWDASAFLSRGEVYGPAVVLAGALTYWRLGKGNQ